MPRPPNILIVVSDQQRGDTLAAGHPFPLVHARSVAAEGVSFTRAFTPSPHCCPARASLWTGLQPPRHGVWNNLFNGQRLSSGLRPGVRCWSADLAAAGWRLEWCGKWHADLATTPADHGWRGRHVTACLPMHNGPTWSEWERRAAGAAPAAGDGRIARPGWGDFPLFGEADDAVGHDADVLGHALAAIDDCAGGGDPWCVFAGFLAPHDPYVAPGRLLDRVPFDRVPLPPSAGDAMVDKPGLYRRLREQVFAPLGERGIRSALRHYWASCLELDERIGALLARLRARGAERDTIVVLLSDHGDYAGDHGLFCKGIPCFTSGYHVPMVWRVPGGARGAEVDAFASLVDVGPTLLELCGVRPVAAMDGASLAPFLHGRTPPAWRDAIHFMCNGVETYATQRAVRTDRWHWTHNAFDRDELYDLRADPHQLRNLADDPAQAAVVRELCGRMWRSMRALDDPAMNDYVTVGLAPHGPLAAFAGWDEGT